MRPGRCRQASAQAGPGYAFPRISIRGHVPDAAVRESRERVRSAVKNCGFELPPRAVVINLAPADIKKEGNHLDLPIALALLVAHGHLPKEALGGRLVCGELGLSGSLRPIRGSLAIADLARLIARVVGYDGAIEFDPSMPDGTPRKLLDISKLTAMGWQPRIALEQGLPGYYADFLKQVPAREMAE